MFKILLVTTFFLTQNVSIFAGKKQVFINKTFSKCYSAVIQQSEKTIFNNKELTIDKKAKKPFLLWKKSDTIPFTDLILSWNASRPKKGRFLFYVNVKHSSWSGWRKLAEWGKNVQKSFYNAQEPFVHTKHVRTVMQRKRLGSEYKIKVESSGGADLRRLKALFVNVSNENNFYNRKLDKKLKSRLDLVGLVPRHSQWWVDDPRRKDFCSPAAISMISLFFENKYENPKKLKDFKIHTKLFANRVYDPSLNIYGNWQFNIAQAFNTTKGRVFYSVQKLNNFEDLYGYISKKIPVAVSIRGNLKNGAWEYKNGHLVVVVGWDQKKKSVVCIDSAFSDKDELLRNYEINDFLKAWGKSRYLAYVAIPKNNQFHFLKD